MELKMPIINKFQQIFNRDSATTSYCWSFPAIFRTTPLTVRLLTSLNVSYTPSPCKALASKEGTPRSEFRSSSISWTLKMGMLDLAKSLLLY